MRAGATYAYSIEIGPADSEVEMLVNGLGFHIKEADIIKVSQTIYDGLYAYMSTFIESMPEKDKKELNRFCSNEYDSIKNKS